MPERDAIRAYLETVQEQIRWKRARAVLALELEQHLEDQRDALVSEGRSPEEAARLAVEDMGDPVALGAELDRVHRPRPQWGPLVLTAALAAACTLLRVVLTAGWRGDGEELPLALTGLALGCACMAGAYFLDVSRLARCAPWVCAGVLVLGLGAIGLQCASPGMLPYRFSLYLALFLPVVYALWVYACRDKGWPGLVSAVAGGVPLVFLTVWWYPSLTNLLVLLLSGFALVLHAAWGDWFGVRRVRGTAVILGVAAVLGWAVWTLWLRHTPRFHILFHPEQDPQGAGWFTLQVRNFLQGIPLLRGGAVSGSQAPLQRDLNLETLLGRNFLPAMLANRWGWAALALLAGAVAALVVWIGAKGLRQQHRLGRLVALAAALALGLRMALSLILNLGVVLFGASFPLLGGNSFLVADMTLIGLALSVFRGGSIAREAPEPPARRRVKRIRLQIEYR